MSKTLLIIGAKGFAKELLVTVLQTGQYGDVLFYDDQSDDVPARLFDQYPIVRDFDEAVLLLLRSDSAFALGIGSSRSRRFLFDRFSGAGVAAATVISPLAVVGKHDNQIGEGTVVLSHAVIEAGNRIGRGCLVHVSALISHDVVVGDFCEISPRVSLLGNVKVGSGCQIGTGAVLLPGIELGDHVVVGAGAVVTKSIEAGQTVAGVPARNQSKSGK